MIVSMGLFSLAMSISPGPVNITTISTGINHGFKRAFAFVSGATVGFTILLLVIGLGLSQLIDPDSTFYDVLKYSGSAFIVYIGIRILIADPHIETKEIKAPGFMSGFLMQWLNPKAWIACISGISLFQLQDSLPELFLFVSIYFVICYISIAVWAFIGARMKTLVQNKKLIRGLNAVLGLVLIGLALYLAFFE